MKSNIISKFLLVWILLSLIACGGKSDDAITNTNLAPISNAGIDQTVFMREVITLDGSASSDANSDQLNYHWSFTSKPVGSTAVLSSIAAAKPTFTADMAGIYELSLIVDDGKLSSVADAVKINCLDILTYRIVTVSWAGAATGVRIGVLQLSIDYDQTKVKFHSALTGSLTSGFLISNKDNGDIVEVLLLSMGSFDGGVSSGSVVKFIFEIVSGTPSPLDFAVLKGKYYAHYSDTIFTPLNPSDVNITIANP